MMKIGCRFSQDGAVLPCLATNVELPHESEDATVTHSLVSTSSGCCSYHSQALNFSGTNAYFYFYIFPQQQNAAEGQASGGLPCEASEHPSTLSMVSIVLL